MDLAQVLPRWSRTLWWHGIRPVHRRLQELGLSLPENIVLRALQRGPLTVAEAAEHLLLSHSAASRAVDRLVEMGLVKRQESADDRRCRHLTLTPKGEKLMARLEETFAQGVQPVLDRLSPEEQQTLTRLLQKMVDA